MFSPAWHAISGSHPTLSPSGLPARISPSLCTSWGAITLCCENHTISTLPQTAGCPLVTRQVRSDSGFPAAVCNQPGLRQASSLYAQGWNFIR